MAGIGFKLAAMARTGGLGGAAAAAAHGAVISAGPWLLAAGAMLALQTWARTTAGSDVGNALTTVLIYAFTASAVVASPIVAVATRAVADRLFDDDRAGVPGLLAAALAGAALPALAVGAVLYGAAGLAPVDQLLATTILALLSQIWVANLFLTAIRRYRSVLLGYCGGIALVAGVAGAASPVTLTALLALTAAGLAATLAVLVATIRRCFAAAVTWPAHWPALARQHAHIAAAGLAGAVALWIDKWLLWALSDGSVAALGLLRHHPVYDAASFLGLLSLVPGLTMLLIVVETRFDRSFTTLMAACSGSATIARIEAARDDVGRAILTDLRLLIVTQATIACLLWVLAPRLIEWAGADARGIFAFRFTVVGGVFHLIALFAMVVLAYFDLFGRVLLIWVLFAIASAVSTLAHLGDGFAGYGWGYLAGAIVAGMSGMALVLQATGSLTYLLFVGNNPAVAGERRRWA